jgi:hypothetical protein
MQVWWCLSCPRAQASMSNKFSGNIRPFVIFIASPFVYSRYSSGESFFFINSEIHRQQGSGNMQSFASGL